MRATRLVALALLVAAAASLVRAAATRDGVGAFEYVASVVIVLILVGLAAATLRNARRA